MKKHLLSALIGIALLGSFQENYAFRCPNGYSGYDFSRSCPCKHCRECQGFRELMAYIVGLPFVGIVLGSCAIHRFFSITRPLNAAEKVLNDIKDELLSLDLLKIVTDKDKDFTEKAISILSDQKDVLYPCKEAESKLRKLRNTLKNQKFCLQKECDNLKKGDLKEFANTIKAVQQLIEKIENMVLMIDGIKDSFRSIPDYQTALQKELAATVNIS